MSETSTLMELGFKLLAFSSGVAIDSVKLLLVVSTADVSLIVDFVTVTASCPAYICFIVTAAKEPIDSNSIAPVSLLSLRRLEELRTIEIPIELIVSTEGNNSSYGRLLVSANDSIFDVALIAMLDAKMLSSAGF
jgi:hypothetical protein